MWHQRKEEKTRQLVAALKQCCKTRNLESGKRLHRDAISATVQNNKYVAAALITMYSRFRSMALARQVFDGVLQRDVVCWNSLILGYVTDGEYYVAMQLLYSMDCDPSPVTYVAALKACGGLARDDPDSLKRGIAIHKQVEERGFESHIVVANALVDMYRKCGAMQLSREVFDRITNRNVVSWTSLILGYVKHGEYLLALSLFCSMDIPPNAFTYVVALQACSSLACEESDKRLSLDKGIAIHKQMEDQGLETDVVVSTALLDMYRRNNEIHRAREVFDRMSQRNVVTWTSLISCYLENGESLLALGLFANIDCEPDCLTYIAVLKACEGLASEQDIDDRRYCLENTFAVHKAVQEKGFVSDVAVATSLMNVHRKLGFMHLAREIFDSMTYHDVIAWNSLILGYVENEEYRLALSIMSEMDCKADSFTYVAGLQACGSVTAIPEGKDIHAKVCKLGLERTDSLVTTTLMDFYCKTGNMNKAEELFNSLSVRDIVSWNTFMSGYSSLGDAVEVLRLAKEMQEANVPMSEITATCILTACSHAGAVEKGKMFVRSMLRHGTRLSIEHYNCIVDMFCRANRIQQALAIVNAMQVEANGVTWMTLLGGSKKWNNMEVGKAAFDALHASGTPLPASFELMRNIYVQN